MILLDSCRAEELAKDFAHPVLGIDTSGPTAYLGLIGKGKILDSHAIPARSHAAGLPDAIAAMLDDHSIAIRDLHAIALGVGPGSFTGVRIALAYAKGIAFASETKLIAVGSLDSIAASALEHVNSAQDVSLCAITDARKGEVYAALYRCVSDRLEKVSEDLLITIDKLVSHLPSDAIFAGDARAGDAAAMRSARAIVDASAFARRGASVALIGAARLARGDIDRSAALEPRYVRAPEAVAKLKKSQAIASASEGVWNSERKNSFGNI